MDVTIDVVIPVNPDIYFSLHQNNINGFFKSSANGDPEYLRDWIQKLMIFCLKDTSE